ncbi:MAG: MIP/aquaporin family protein [Rubripirellula sp.]
MSEPLARRCLAEFLSTFCLVLLGCGAMAVDSRTGALTHVGVALSWGLIVMVMIYAVGGVSGAHMNPAVTIAFATQKKLPLKDVLGYVPAQCLGALCGALAIRAALGLDDAMLGATSVQLNLGLVAGMLIELVLTAILMFVVMGVSTGAKEETITAGIAVGATIALEAMVGGPLTKASMNPARSFGPAIASGDVSELWVYFVGPILGAIIGAIASQCIRAGKHRVKEVS